MDQDEKTERGHRSPAVRSTAPAGTPYPVAPNPPPAAPKPTASQPRTVGGHTARLAVPEDDALALEIDPLAPGSSEPPLPRPIGEPISVTIGGTQRLEPVSPEQAAAARKELEAQSEPPASKAPPSKKEPLSSGKAPVAPTVVDPSLSAKPAAPKPEGRRLAALLTGARLEALLSPVSVAVGLVFFAMGCMIGLVIEGRFISLTVTTAPVTAVAPPPPTVAGPVHTAATTATTTHPAPTTTLAPAAPSAKPAVPPSTSRPQQGTGGSKLPPLPFHP
jgi:hypothetical protein